MELTTFLLMTGIAYTMGYATSYYFMKKEIEWKEAQLKEHRRAEMITTIKTMSDDVNTRLANIVHEIMKQEWTQRDNAHSVGLVVRNYVSRIKEIMK